APHAGRSGLSDDELLARARKVEAAGARVRAARRQRGVERVDLRERAEARPARPGAAAPRRHRRAGHVASLTEATSPARSNTRRLQVRAGLRRSQSVPPTTQQSRPPLFE